MARSLSAQTSASAILALLASTGLARAQPFSANFPTPFLDRWNYPFGDAGGNRSTASLFTTLGSPFVGQNGFDDRDAEMLIGFSTAASIAQVPASQYALSSVKLRVMVNVPSGQPGFVYDNTYDSANTYPDLSGSSLTADTDAGRPLELFGCDYRAGFTSTTFLENSPFSSIAPVISPARECRNVFPIDFGTTGAARDVSNNITGAGAVGSRFEVEPLAIGQAIGVAQSNLVTIDPPPAVGAAVPNRTIMEFTINLALPGVRGYIAQGLSTGRLNLMVTCLANATPFGGGPVNYPVLFTKENSSGLPAQLLIAGSITSACNPADIAGSGATYINGAVDLPADSQLGIDDFIVFLAAFSDGAGCSGIAPCNPADIAGSGATYSNGAVDSGPDGDLSIDDFIIFLAAFSDATGCP